MNWRVLIVRGFLTPRRAPVAGVLVAGALAAGFALAGCGGSENRSSATAAALQPAAAVSDNALVSSQHGSGGSGHGGQAGTGQGGAAGSGQGDPGQNQAQTASSQTASSNTHGTSGASSAAHGSATTAPPRKRHGGSGQSAGTASGHGGLSVSPGILEHVASVGGVGALTVTNTTSAAMAVKLALRPWVQSRGGEVSPNRRRVLSEARPETSSFSLAAGANRTVGISLTRKPRGGSLYGAVEVTGAPAGQVNNGLKLDYRLVTSLRLDAPHARQSFRATAGRLIEQGNVKHGTLLLAVRNTGNTIVPIGGVTRISGQGHSLSANATAKAIIPGASVNLPLTQLLGSLSKGRYTVTVSLSQGTHRLGTLRHTIDLH